MTKLADGTSRYLAADIEKLPWLGEGDDLMRILHIDESLGQVVFIQRFARNTRHVRHTHHCTAVAYTISGAWAYEDGKFPAGAVTCEPAGSTHTAQTVDGDVAEVLVILTSVGGGRLLEMHLDDGSTLEFDLETFKEAATLRADEWPAFQMRLASKIKPPGARLAS